MLIENEFPVAAAPADLWAHLLDVERIAPCLPGAELTETVDERNWKGNLSATFGPVTMSFTGTVTMESRDDEAHRVVLRARGMERKGRGAAEATTTAWLEPGPASGSTIVKVQAEIVLSGAVAQLSRGLLPEIARKLTQQFAECLEASMSAELPPTIAAGARTDAAGVAAPAARPLAPAAPVGGLRLVLSALWSSIRSVVRRLFRRPSGT